MKTLSTLSIWVLASVSSLALVGCSSEPDITQQVADAPAIEVMVKPVELGIIPLYSVVPGSVVSDQRAQISSRLVGFIKDLDVKVGQEVKQGTLLFSIDSADIKSAIAKARSGYLQAKASLANAQSEFNRFEQLFKEKSISKQRFDRISLQFSVAKEQMRAARIGLNQAQSQLRYANVKAPFDGVIVQKFATAGDLATPNAPVLVLENKAALSIETQVSHNLYATLRIGDVATIVLDGIEQPVLATIYTMVGAADPRTRTHRVKLRLNEDYDISSGTFARISFTKGERQTMMLPKTAILNRSGIRGVFVIENDISYFNMVRLGVEIGDKVEIKAGVQLSDMVVIHNHNLLNGSRVIITNKQPS